jgi:tRNA uridine 5-carboxymethylaminomethyl modification enzyme
VNAALSVRGEEPLILRRDESYLGVMVDDLITKEHAEPYRLFTSRSEFRLLLRQDNADLRLSGIAHRLGLVSDEFRAGVERKREAVARELERLAHVRVPLQVAGALLGQDDAAGSTESVSGLQLLRRPEVSYALVERLCPPPQPLPDEARETVEIEAKYAGYLERQEREVARFTRLERRRIPMGTDFSRVQGMRAEARERMAAVRPLTVGQAGRLSGVNPSDVAALLAYLERQPESDGGRHVRSSA